MKLHPIDTGYFKLDGGAMFGIVPKVIWQKTNPADSDNLVDIAARCLLIENGDKLILVDTGIGDKQSDKFFSYYKPFGDETLEKSINQKGFSLDDITDVFLTHLHFDHCGGAMKWDKNREKIIPTFKNAKYWSNQNHWSLATNPNPREKASFLEENILTIEQTGQLNFIDFKGENFISKNQNPLNIGIFKFDGHTEFQMVPALEYKGHKIVYVADLIPFAAHIPINYIVGYDTKPLVSMKEKASFLEIALEKNYLLMFEHDPKNILVDLQKTDRGIRIKNSYSWNEVFGEG